MPIPSRTARPPPHPSPSPSRWTRPSPATGATPTAPSTLARQQLPRTFPLAAGTSPLFPSCLRRLLRRLLPRGMPLRTATRGASTGRRRPRGRSFPEATSGARSRPAQRERQWSWRTMACQPASSTERSTAMRRCLLPRWLRAARSREPARQRTCQAGRLAGSRASSRCTTGSRGRCFLGPSCACPVRL